MQYIMPARGQLAAELHLKRMTGVIVDDDFHALGDEQEPRQTFISSTITSGGQCPPYKQSHTLCCKNFQILCRDVLWSKAFVGLFDNFSSRSITIRCGQHRIDRFGHAVHIGGVVQIGGCDAAGCQRHKVRSNGLERIKLAGRDCTIHERNGLGASSG